MCRTHLLSGCGPGVRAKAVESDLLVAYLMVDIHDFVFVTILPSLIVATHTQHNCLFIGNR